MRAADFTLKGRKSSIRRFGVNLSVQLELVVVLKTDLRTLHQDLEFDFTPTARGDPHDDVVADLDARSADDEVPDQHARAAHVSVFDMRGIIGQRRRSSKLT